MSNIILNIINIVTSIICILMVFKAVSINKSKLNIPKKKSIELTPAEVNLLVHGYNHAPRIITAQILDLEYNGNIKTRFYERENRAELDFKRITDEGLSIAELAFMEMIFMGKDENNTENIKRLVNNSDTMPKLQANWFDTLESEIKKLGLYDDKSKTLAGKYSLAGAVTAIFGAISLFSGQFLGFVAIIAACLVLFMGLNFNLEKSVLGHELTNYWTDLMNRYRIGDKEFDTERDFIYAIALNLPMMHLEKLYENILKAGNSSELLEKFMQTNDEGGSIFDDVCMRSFIGFEKQTTRENTETTIKLLRHKS